MSSLISEQEKQVLAGIFDSIFDTFQRQIVIYKSPIKTYNTLNNPNDLVFGFGDSQAEQAFTLTPVSGVYPATIRYTDQIQSYTPELNKFLPAGSVTIKVKRDCRDFINTDKTENVLIDERWFELISEERRQSFLDSEFYVFVLKSTK